MYRYARLFYYSDVERRWFAVPGVFVGTPEQAAEKYGRVNLLPFPDENGTTAPDIQGNYWLQVHEYPGRTEKE